MDSMVSMVSMVHVGRIVSGWMWGFWLPMSVHHLGTNEFVCC